AVLGARRAGGAVPGRHAGAVPLDVRLARPSRAEQRDVRFLFGEREAGRRGGPDPVQRGHAGHARRPARHAYAAAAVPRRRVAALDGGPGARAQGGGGRLSRYFFARGFAAAARLMLVRLPAGAFAGLRSATGGRPSASTLAARAEASVSASRHSASESLTSSAFRFCSTCSGLVAPRIALETAGFRSTHASPTAPGCRSPPAHHAARRSGAAPFSAVSAFWDSRKWANVPAARLPAG